MAGSVDSARKGEVVYVPRRRSSHAAKLLRASLVISYCTGLPVFCWMTVERLRMLPLRVTSPILILHRVAAAQLAVDGKIEPGSVAKSPVLIEIEPDGPYVARLQRAFRSAF
jgi:hypothetical protein